MLIIQFALDPRRKVHIEDRGCCRLVRPVPLGFSTAKFNITHPGRSRVLGTQKGLYSGKL